MSLDYGFWFYYYFEEKNRTALEKFFSNLQAKLAAFIDQVNRTTELYESDNIQRNKDIDQQYNRDIAKAGKRYDEIFSQYDNDPNLANQIASHESGIDQIEAWYQNQAEPLLHRYREMKDSYYKSALGLLHSEFEGEIKQLCALLQQEFQIHKDLKNVRSGNGGLLADVDAYFNQFVGLNLNDIQTLKQKMDDFRLLRNSLTHEMGKVSQQESWLTNLLTDPNFLELESIGQQQLVRILTPNYLYDYQRTLNSYFRGIYWAIDELKGYNQIEEKLKHLFGFIDPSNLKISNLNVTSTAQPTFNKVINLNLEYDNNPPIPYVDQLLVEPKNLPSPNLHTIAVQVIFGIGESDKLEILNKLGQDEKISILKLNLDQNPNVVFDQIFNLFYFQPECRTMKIVFTKLSS